MKHSPSARLWADLALFLVAVVWGSAFVFQRTAMEQTSPFAFNAVRFGLGGLTLLPIIGWRRARSKSALQITPLLRGGSVLGILLFSAASLQQIGLVETTAGKSGFITSLYIVIVPLLLALVWRESIGWNNWLGAGLATVGLFLLSVQSEFRLASGDGWVLISAFLWALHVIAIGRLAPERDPLQLALVQYGVCALLSACAAFALEQGTWSSLSATWTSIAYTGVLSIGLGYTMQVVAQRHTSAVHTAIILSLESVFAAVAGWLMLGETMTPRMIVGAMLMLAGISVAQAIREA